MYKSVVPVAVPGMRGTHDQTISDVRVRPGHARPAAPVPTCDHPLVFRETVINGIKPIERWDYLECRTCGPFVYRHRTRKLRFALDGTPGKVA